MNNLDDAPIAYFRERKLLSTCPLSALSGTRLGIDGVHYIKTLLSEVDTREPLVASTGGLPLAISARIETNLRALETLHIKPVFVFAGLPISSKPPPKGLDPVGERELATKNEAWGHYESGEVNRAIQTLTQVRGGAWTDWRDLIRSVLRIFRHRFTEYVVAPYLEWAQVRRCQGRGSRDTAEIDVHSSRTSSTTPKAISTRCTPLLNHSSGLWIVSSPISTGQITPT